MIIKIFSFKLLLLIWVLVLGIPHNYSYAAYITIQGDVQHYIDPKGVLYFNIDDHKGGMIAAQLDLNQFVPIIYPTHLTMTEVEFRPNQIRAKGYLRPSILIDYSIHPETKQIINAVYHKEPTEPTIIKSGIDVRSSRTSIMEEIVSEMNLESIPDSGMVIVDSQVIGGEILNELEVILSQKPAQTFAQFIQSNRYTFNILMVHASRNSFKDMKFFLDYIVSSLLMEERDVDSFQKAKLFYLHYLQNYYGYNDLPLIMWAIDHNDLDFINKGKLNSLNKLGKSQLSSYIYSECSPLGKAILMNQYAMTKLLLDKSATMDVVCKYDRNDSFSALDVAEKQKNRRMIRIIRKYLSNQ